MNLYKWALQQGWEFPKDLKKLEGLRVKTRSGASLSGITYDAYMTVTPCVRIRGQDPYNNNNRRCADECELAVEVENDL